MEKHNLLMSNCLTYKNELQIPLISTCIEISIFEKLGYFDNNLFGEDEHLYYRFFNTFQNYPSGFSLKFESEQQRS